MCGHSRLHTERASGTTARFLPPVAFFVRLSLCSLPHLLTDTAHEPLVTVHAICSAHPSAQSVAKDVKYAAEDVVKDTKHVAKVRSWSSL